MTIAFYDYEREFSLRSFIFAVAFALIWVVVINLTGMPSGLALTTYVTSLLDPVSAVGGLSFSLAWGLGVPETLAIGLGWLSLFIAAAIGAWFGRSKS